MVIDFSTEIPKESSEIYKWTIFCGTERICIKLENGKFHVKKEGEKQPIMTKKAGFFSAIGENRRKKKEEEKILREQKERQEKEELEKTLRLIKERGEWTEL